MKKKIFILLSLVIICFGLYHSYKPLPEGLSLNGEAFSVPNESLTFLSDITYINLDSEYVSEQDIFDEVFTMIDVAENFILIDMFLYNDFMGKEDVVFRAISSELTERLIEKKKESPEIQILVITDPLNTIYGGIESLHISKLKESNIHVVTTNLRKLRDSNPVYSSLWRPFLRFLPVDFIKLTNPFIEGGQKVGLNVYLELLNFKANHRKLIVSDFLDANNVLKVSSLVTSANPHDGSSRHSNVAIKINDFIWRDIIKSEIAVLNFSSDLDFDIDFNLYTDTLGDVKVQLLTEKQIKNSLIQSINETHSDDTIKMLMFYISDRDIVKALKKAEKRGVDLKIVLDPNKDAFGRGKNGVPAVSVAKEFKKQNEDFPIKWCYTNGEQCHSKMIIIEKEDGQHLFIGSANLTKRNLDDYNLETNVKVSGQSVNAIEDAKKYFYRIWNNEAGQYSVDYEFYRDESFWKYVQYRIMEGTGMSSF